MTKNPAQSTIPELLTDLFELGFQHGKAIGAEKPGAEHEFAEQESAEAVKVEIAKRITTSPGEMDVLRHLAFAWNRFLDLEIQHPDERAEFRKAIHDLQGLVATRIARRCDPYAWPTHREEAGT